VFTLSRKGRFDLYQHLASGAGSDELLVADDSEKFPWTFNRDGRIVTYWRAGRGASASGLGILQLEDRKASVAGAEGGAYGHLSPDGRWIAYEDGGEVVAVPYPLSGGKWQISSAGGRRPRWRALDCHAEEITAARARYVNLPVGLRCLTPVPDYS